MNLGITELTVKARKDLGKITGLEPSSVVKTARDDRGWRISIEMVEKHSIPDSMDILATYEALVDEEGNILEFNRRGMRKRNESLAE
ncbi:MAG: gas vesicle protein [Deltaproteobacteria bacterium]|nr:gas vesicle protein [Deltaproteobacteria bacterium]MBI5809770.1 gas vesicle protein [Deltaproteobacteria bacterium]